MKIARNRYITAPEERDIPESPFQNALTAADEAGKILSGKLTEKELSRLVRYSYYKSDLAKTRNFFNSLDPDILRSIFTKLPDEGARGRVVNCIQDYTFQDFISKNPNQFQRLVNIFIGVASLPKINSIRDNFSVF